MNSSLPKRHHLSSKALGTLHTISCITSWCLRGSYSFNVTFQMLFLCCFQLFKILDINMFKFANEESKVTWIDHRPAFYGATWDVRDMWRACRNRLLESCHVYSCQQESKARSVIGKSDVCYFVLDCIQSNENLPKKICVKRKSEGKINHVDILLNMNWCKC